jgi:hypothetical protein
MSKKLKTYKITINFISIKVSMFQVKYFSMILYNFPSPWQALS